MTRYLLDVTRTLSRVGRGVPTGIDRVEHAYIRDIAHRDTDALAVARIGKDYVLSPLARLADVLPDLHSNQRVARPGWRDALRLKLPPAQRAARSFLRRHAISQGRSMAAVLNGVRVRTYVNVGHTNLSPQTFAAVRQSGAEAWIMVHDLIPLDYPEFTRQGVAHTFAKRMMSVSKFADRIICNSHATAESVKTHFQMLGRVPPTIVAHLGVEPNANQHTPADEPIFITLGTIEPRKNHTLLLDVWDRIGATSTLRIIGKRGWMNEAVFQRLDTRPPGVEELSGITDTDLAAHLSQARALLFPSHAEGFGLPALEAAQIGLPVICSDLPVFRELLGTAATYLDANDADAWEAAIRAVAQTPAGRQNAGTDATASVAIPRWDSHFRHVFGEK